MFNDETQEVDLETSTEEAEEDTTQEEERGVEYWKAEALKNKAILDRNKGKEVTKEVQSDGFNNGDYAYMSQKGIETDKEIELMQQAMKDSGKSMRDVLQSSWFKSDLKELQDLNKTANATIKGKQSGSTATDSVEYWATKEFSEVPQNMRYKVVEFKEKAEANKGKFYNS